MRRISTRPDALAARVRLAAAIIAALGATACPPFFKAVGFRDDAGAPVVIRNDGPTAVNVYALPRSSIGEVFLGQVKARGTRTFHLRDAAACDTASLRAARIDGSGSTGRHRVVLGDGASWRIETLP